MVAMIDADDARNSAALLIFALIVAVCAAVAFAALYFAADATPQPPSVGRRVVEQSGGGGGGARVAVVVVEGNIAAGKSTFIEHVGAALRRRGVEVCCVAEPIEAWQRAGTSARVDLLAASYADPAANAFAFQLVALVTHARAMREAIERVVKSTNVEQSDFGNLGNRAPTPVVLVERSAWSYRHVFVERAREAGHVSREQLAAYEVVYAELNAAMPPSASQLVVYLDAATSECARRRRERGRECEHALDERRLAQLDLLYAPLASPSGTAARQRTLHVDVERELVGLPTSTSVADHWAARLLDELARAPAAPRARAATHPLASA